MISDHLERYYEVHRACGRKEEHVILRSMVIDGHEVAWVELRDAEPLPEGRRPFRMMMCECDYIEGVAWQTDERHGVVGLDNGKGDCVRRGAALHLRHLELRKEYAATFDRRNVAGLTEEETLIAILGLSSPEALRHIILDLVTKAKAGEWLEEGTGAMFWGGYYYVQTVQAITDAPWKSVWDAVRALVDERRISLEGAVVRDHREPEIPGWEECFRVETEDGWLGIAWLPAHGDMDSEWKLEVFRPDRSRACDPVHLPMLYEPTFGPDAGDVAAAEERLAALIAEWKP